MAARNRTTRSTKPAADNPLAAFTPEQIAALQTLLGGVTAPAPEAEPVGVKASARKAEDEAASLRQKRTLADYTRDSLLAKPRVTKAQRDKVTAAEAAYEAALNTYLLALGVKGPANLLKSEAFDMIASLKAERSA